MNVFEWIILILFIDAILLVVNCLFFSPWLFLRYTGKMQPKFVTWFIRNTNNEKVLLFMVALWYFKQGLTTWEEENKRRKKQMEENRKYTFNPKDPFLTDNP